MRNVLILAAFGIALAIFAHLADNDQVDQAVKLFVGMLLWAWVVAVLAVAVRGTLRFLRR